MSRITEIRKNVSESTPVLVVVGATDVVVERVRVAAADAQKVQAGLEEALNTYQVELRKGLQAAQLELGKTVQAYQVGLEPARIQAKVTEAVQQIPAQVQQVPALAVSRALEVAGQVESSYAELAERGKQLVERVRRQQPTQDLLAQSRITGTLAKAAVTTARKAVDDTAAAARNAVTISRREAGDVVPAVEEQVERSVAQTEKVVEKRTAGTRAAAKRTAATARTRANTTKTAAKATVTSARKTATKAAEATEAAADKVGD
jgi:heparin binding hemagglutinin HbhA